MNTHTTKAGTKLPIMNLKGKDYLEVKYRIVWFREEHPTWSIETEFTIATEKLAAAKATVKDESGRIVSTSHKIEHAAHFNDFMEKAETGAIGRALALIGYGTQFCGDELDEGDRIVDSPVGRQNPHAAKNFQPTQEEAGEPGRWGYMIPFGKYQKRSLEEVDQKDLANYVNWLESNSAKTGKPLGAQQLEFIDRASAYLASMESGSDVGSNAEAHRREP